MITFFFTATVVVFFASLVAMVATDVASVRTRLV